MSLQLNSKPEHAPVIKSYRIDSFGYLEIEFELNQVSYLRNYFFDVIRRCMRSDSPHLDMVFRLVRMSYELSRQSTISNISANDLTVLEALPLQAPTADLFKVINWAKAQDLPSDSLNYVTEADQARAVLGDIRLRPECRMRWLGSCS